VLYVAGGDSDLRLPDDELDDRLAILRAQRATVAASGHHPHLEQPEALAQVLIGFLQGQ
jgi:pimeloyl-ACP methyl ester carboxylesterase